MNRPIAQGMKAQPAPALSHLLAVLDRAQQPAPPALAAEVNHLMDQAAALGLIVSPVQAVLAVQATGPASDVDKVSPAVHKTMASPASGMGRRPGWQRTGATVLGLMALGGLAGFLYTAAHAQAQVLAGQGVDLKALDHAMGVWMISSAISALGASALWHVRQLAEGTFFLRAEATLGVGPWIRVK